MPERRTVHLSRRPALWRRIVTHYRTFRAVDLPRHRALIEAVRLTLT